MPGARNFDYQDPVKNLLVRESNLKYGGNPITGQGRKPAKAKQNRFEYDYHSSAWEKLISKTQETSDFLTKGDYARAPQRDFESEVSQRILTPSS